MESQKTADQRRVRSEEMAYLVVSCVEHFGLRRCQLSGGSGECARWHLFKTSNRNEPAKAKKVAVVRKTASRRPWDSPELSSVF